MKVGLDAFTLHPLGLDAEDTLDFAEHQGLDGVQFGGLNGISAKLDHQELRDFRQRADGLGLYTDVSAPSPNICNVDCDRQDWLRELQRHVEAAAAADWHELHAVLGGPETRYEHEIPWTEHLTATESFLKELTPILKTNGSRINLEDHGEITTFELLRLIETVGDDVLGVCLDTANVLCFAEDPVAAARRVAPYTHLTHAKDAIIYFCDEGIQRQGRPPGQGVVDWPSILPILAEYSPDLPLSIEDHKWLFKAEIFRSQWQQQNPDLTRDELCRVIEIAWDVQKRIQAGELPDPEGYEKAPFADELHTRLRQGAEYLRHQVKALA